MEGHNVVVKALIAGGADVNKADNDGRTPVYKGTRPAPHHALHTHLYPYTLHPPPHSQPPMTAKLTW